MYILLFSSALQRESERYVEGEKGFPELKKIAPYSQSFHSRLLQGSNTFGSYTQAAFLKRF